MSDRVLLPHTSDHFPVVHRNLDGVVPNPLLVSAGVDEWHDYTFMHADYFAANQPVFNNGLLDLRLRDAPDSVTFAGPIRGGRRHADYFAANQAVFQPVFNEALLDDCIMNLPDWVTEADQPASQARVSEAFRREACRQAERSSTRTGSTEMVRLLTT